ncbi:hypothetical protein ATCC90586_002939 [Pythium insidiosum]|nr:hypothetical protein ATCC90586_002939 [Pythium insidiosum]
MAASAGGAGGGAGAGGVRVCARFRPQNKLELQQSARECVRVDDGTTVRLQGGGATDATFTFDQVFGTASTQADVYAATAKPLVDAALRGYNCTCFVYGQTGTGKTFSMEGVPGDAEFAGIIPRTMADIFDGIRHMQAELEFIVRVSYIEIYLEKIRDLLEPASTNLSVRESRERGVWVAGAKEVCCASAEEMLAVMRVGGAHRVISSTRMNNDSSRSHSVFIITIEQRNVATGSTKSGKLFLVDLAGSEKVGKTHAKGQTLKEAQHINKSLSALGSVMNALTSGQPNAHVPYRDSKLTRLLQDALGGNSETTLLVCASCSSYNAEETLSTLRFGSRAKNIKNKPKVNEERTVAEYKQLLQDREQLIAALQQQLHALSSAEPDALTGAADADLLARAERLEDELATKSSEAATLEERVAELEASQHEWQEKDVALGRRTQQCEELTSKLAFTERELEAKTRECDELRALVAKQSGVLLPADELSPKGAVVAAVTGIETELLRQQLHAKSTELQLCSSRLRALTDELENCRGFYERQLDDAQARLAEYEATVKGVLALAESDDRSAQLDSLLQQSKALRSVRGGGSAEPPSPPASSSSSPSPSSLRRRRLTSSASTDGWALDDEVFPLAPVDMESPVVQRVLAAMPERGREKMAKWLTFVLEGRDIRGAQFHPELSLEGLSDDASRDMRRLIVPLLRRRADIDVETWVRTRFVKVADLKIRLVHRHRDTMRLAAAEAALSDEEAADDEPAGDGGDGDGGDEGQRTRRKRASLGRRWAQDHLFFGPKSDPSSDSVLHGHRTLSSNPRVDRFVSEPVDMSAGLLESKTILGGSDAVGPAPSSTGFSSSSVSAANANANATAADAPRSESSATASAPLSGGVVGGLLSRFRASTSATVGTVLGDVKTALHARYHRHHVHEDSLCAGCGVSPIVGAKWTCHTCDDVELCDACYGRGVHGREVSAAMCRRLEQLATQRHRALAAFPELFALLRTHICDDDAVQFRQLIDWLGDIVAGKPATQLQQRSIVKSGLHPEIRARLVAQLGAIASERTDLELKTEWFVEKEEEEEEEEEEEDGSGHVRDREREDATTPSVATETLRMYVVDVAGEAPRSQPTGGGDKMSTLSDSSSTSSSYSSGPPRSSGRR